VRVRTGATRNHQVMAGMMLALHHQADEAEATNPCDGRGVVPLWAWPDTVSAKVASSASVAVGCMA
jgi:hypothetical protein